MDTVLLLMLLVAVCGTAVLLYLYLSLKQQIAVQAAQDHATLREAALSEAQAQLTQWRQQELEQTKQQQLETARSEYAVEFARWKLDYEQRIRQDAVQRSQSVTLGKITEHLVPYLPGFAYNPKDVRFIGSPIDLLIFDGLSDGDSVQGLTIVFLEVKTGTSSLSARERQVRDAVLAGRVQWVEYRPVLDSNRVAVK
jgi:predicted Holliday junction resolvase-like endonuclease